MRFSVKVFLATIVVVVLSFSAGGYVLITSLFHSALEQEVTAALAENRMLRLSYEATLISTPASGQATRELLQQLSSSLVESSAAAGTTLRLYNASQDIVYESAAVSFGSGLLASIDQENRSYQIQAQDGNYYIQTACLLPSADANPYYLESIREISSVFSLRDAQFMTYRKIMLVMTLVSGGAVFALSHVLTRPIRRLSRTTHRIADGALSQRAPIDRWDEIGELAVNFNHMADEVEHRILELEAMNRRQEDFVASFAHELKTPLTSIIGYADMLRSKELAPEDRFLAANYIFREGKRLESLSLKLLDLIVLGKRDFVRKPVSAKHLFASIEAFMRPLLAADEPIRFQATAEDAVLQIEPDLFQTLLINLLDNARKALDGQGNIRLIGQREAGGYAIYVYDNGKGIPAADLPRITEAFYMADKSRTRNQGGAGLGLAICNEIAQLHGSKIEFRSEPGKGTMVRVFLSEVQNAETESHI